jgi:hypothetical protein
MMKLFEPPMFKKKEIPFYGPENKKFFTKYQKSSAGKPSKNFTKDEVNAIKSIFMTKGNIVVMKHVSDALHEFFKLEFGFSLNDCKEAVFEIDPNTLKAVDLAKDPFLNNQIYKALQEAAYGDGVDWAEEVMELSGFEAEHEPEPEPEPVPEPEYEEEVDVPEFEEPEPEPEPTPEPAPTPVFTKSPLPDFPIIITSEDDEKVIEFMNRHNIDIPIYYNHRHPKYAEDVAEILNQIDQTYICYDTVVLDYVNLDKVYVINDNFELVPVKSYAEYAEKFGYMHLGEIILNYNNMRDNEGRFTDEDKKVAGYDVITA